MILPSGKKEDKKGALRFHGLFKYFNLRKSDGNDGKEELLDRNEMRTGAQGEKVEERGVCLAATDERLKGVHGGENAGRACWVIAGTFCEGEVQGTFAQKYQDCTACNFYRQVKKEEGMRYLTSLVLLKKLKVIR